MMFVGCCLFFVVCRSSLAVCCLVFVVCFLSCVVRCLSMFVVR